MKKLVSIIILCLACLGGLEAQNYWEFIDHSSTLLGVAPSGSIFFHQGNSGIARMAYPNGACPIVIGPTTGFSYLFNPHCFSVSPEGRIFLFNDGLNAVMYSDDNGDTWQQMPVVSSCAMTEVADLYATSNDTIIGWATNGEIFWTTDAGETWGYSILSFLENSESVNDLLVNENGDVYVSVAYYIIYNVGIYHSTLSDMQNWELVAFEGVDIEDMAFDPEGNVVACGYNADGSSVSFQHIPGFYLFAGSSLAVSNSGVVYTPQFAGHSAVLSYSLDHGETFVNVGEDIPLVDIAPGDGSGYLFKGYDNYLYFVSGTEYWKSIPNADEIPTFNPLVGVKFYDEASRLYYIITSANTVEVTYDQWHFNTYVGDYVVPETVTYEGVTYTVTAIGELAFGGCEGELNSVIVSNTVTTIERSAFESSTKLRTVVLPNSVENIAPRTFTNCAKLSSVRLPDGITYIPNFMFEGCESLTSFTIPPTVTHIGESAFNNSGIVINSIPENVTSIGNNAFYYCEGITSMVIPNTVTSLGWGVFCFCRELQSIQLPDNLEAIPATFLKNCFALSSITIPESVTSIGEEAFSGCTHLTSVVIPEAVTSMGNGVFQNCYNLASIDMPETLDYLGEKAFRECERLTSITLPRNLTKVCNEVFEGCSALHQIEIPESVTSIGNRAFVDCNLEEVVIPNQVDSIGLNAFDGCQGLSHVVLGTSVSYLGEYALNTVESVGDSLTVECLGTTPPRCGYTTFPDAALQGKMIVPCGYEDVYREALGEYWASGNFEEDCDFAGLEWYYEILNENGSITYQHLEYVADTTINHKDVQIIIRTNTLYDKGEHSEVTREYVYGEDGIIYWWNKDLQDFTVLYDYNAEAGDEWEIKVGTQRITMHVDAVEQYEYENQQFRLLQVCDADDIFSGTIVCGIGHLTSFFPEKLMTRGKNYRVEGMRCYWRDGELFFKYGEEDCDAVYKDYHSGIEEDGPSTPSTGSGTAGTLTVYPNPANNNLFVETRRATSLPEANEYHITNLMGQTVLTGSITAEPQQIDVSDLPQGMYFITVGDMTQKFVIR